MTKEHYNHWFPKLINARGVTIYNHIFYIGWAYIPYAFRLGDVSPNDLVLEYIFG